VHADGWKIDGCPVNGPAVAADGEVVAVAWFTAAGDTARVRVAFSTDAGATFGAPIDLESGVAALGRVDVVLQDDGTAMITWLSRTSREKASVAIAAVRRDGTVIAQATLGDTDASRQSGFPRMARAGTGVLVAWTDTGSATVKLASVTRRQATASSRRNANVDLTSRRAP
jgi:hypothetical protein